jgi:surface antigen
VTVRHRRVTHGARSVRRWTSGIAAAAAVIWGFVAIGAGAGSTAPAATVHRLPGSGVTGVTVLCGYAADYSCTTGGYSGQSVGWWGQKYGAGYASSNAYGYHNCTLYAAYKIAQNGVGDPGWSGNAIDWANKAGAKGTVVNQTPAVGAVAQWNAGGAGHVGYVEILTSTYIEVTDDNYDSSDGGGTDRFRIRLDSSAMPDNFIHFKDLGAPIPPDGTLVEYQGAVYQLAGGAPVYVSTWATYGGQQPTTLLSSLQWDALPQYPRDGTFLRAAQTGQVYVVAGGAPIYVSTWATYGAQQPAIDVDQAALDKMSTTSPWNHLRAVPPDGTLLTAAQTGRVYITSGGVPSYVDSWSAFGGPQPTVTIDQAAVRNAGTGGFWNHLSAAGGSYRSVAPARILDSRDGTGVVAGAVGAGQVIDVQVGGAAGIPGTGVSAVAVTLTVVDPTASGYLTPFAQGTAMPVVSALNFAAGTNVAALAIVPLSASGKISIYNGSTGSSQLLADVTGYYVSGSAALPGTMGTVRPTRVLDTRIGTGAPAIAIAPAASVTVAFGGVAGVPSTGVAAVMMTLTVTDPKASGYITAYAAGSGMPLASNLNFATGQTVANLALVPVGTNGKVTFYNGSQGTIALLADVAGYIVTGKAAAVGSIGIVSPTRVLDTRNAVGAPASALGSNATVNVQLTGVGQIPTSGISAVIANVTATDPSSNGYVTAFPQGGVAPPVSNLNYIKGSTVPDLAIVLLGPAGKFALFNGSTGTVQLVADIAGYILSPL